MTLAAAAQRSFYAPPPPLARSDDLLLAYLSFLEERNGPTEGAHSFCRREARMAQLAVPEPDASVTIDAERFDKNYVDFDGQGLTEEELALLAFVKVNAGEAYGVQVTSEARAHLHRGDAPFARVERTLLREEDYHTKLLVGAVGHFEGVQVTDAWTPHWTLKLLIGGLATFPAALFHPVLLGSELAGVFQFNWMLQRLGTLFPDDSGVRESMEERLLEILVDEVGHVAFNRIAVGPAGMRASRWVAASVLSATPQMVPELQALGLDAQARRELSTFDYHQLPEEVRRRAFFA
ncbi:MAG: hypothetical protein KTR31_22690 [Myxococcales bacterium]|nr:hypothetical protein [Myxococcales bacterium]